MRLLLTSAGLTNESVSNALLELTRRPFKELSLVFIPTAANVEVGEKEWLIDDLWNCKKLGFKKIDIVDIAALAREEIMYRLKAADILFFGGGNTHYLMEQIMAKQLKDKIVELLRTRVYVGLSAGSMIAGGWWSCAYDTRFYDEPEGPDRYDCLGLTDVHIMPHLSPSEFPKVNLEHVGQLAQEVKEPIYALDDNSAVKIDGQSISVVSEGKWKKFN